MCPACILCHVSYMHTVPRVLHAYCAMCPTFILCHVSYMHTVPCVLHAYCAMCPTRILCRVPYIYTVPCVLHAYCAMCSTCILCHVFYMHMTGKSVVSSRICPQELTKSHFVLLHQTTLCKPSVQVCRCCCGCSRGWRVPDRMVPGRIHSALWRDCPHLLILRAAPRSTTLRTEKGLSPFADTAGCTSLCHTPHCEGPVPIC
jgi:hypothetical protein